MKKKDIYKYILERTGAIRNFSVKGSGTLIELPELDKFNVFLTAYHAIRDSYNKNRKAIKDIKVSLFKVYNDDLIVTDNIGVNGIIDYDEKNDFALLWLDYPQETRGADIYHGSINLFDKVYSSGMAPADTPMPREGTIIRKNMDIDGYPITVIKMNATHGDSGSGIFKVNKVPEVIGITRGILQTKNEIQYVTLSTPHKRLLEFLEEYF